jgi:hypothetical protein
MMINDNDMEKLNEEMVRKGIPGWRLTDLILPVTYYEDGVAPTDNRWTSIRQATPHATKRKFRRHSSSESFPLKKRITR